MKHTQTPWKITRDIVEDLGYMIHKENSTPFSSNSDNYICYSRFEHNAKFIIKAVNNHERLLNILQEAYSELLSYHENYSNSDYPALFSEIREILDDVKGLKIKQAESEK